MLLPFALKCGIGLFDFWELTYGEILMLMNNYKEQREEKSKEEIANNYQIAYLTSIFTNKANNGKQPPTLQEMYPDLFPVEENEETESNSWLFYKEKMIDYAQEHNHIVKEVSK